MALEVRVGFLEFSEDVKSRILLVVVVEQVLGEVVVVDVRRVDLLEVARRLGENLQILRLYKETSSPRIKEPLEIFAIGTLFRWEFL